MESHIYVEGVVGDDWFTDNPITLTGIRNQIQDDTEAITLHINSPGGYVTEAWAIHDYIRTSGKKTKAVINGMCASAATIIAAAADEVEMTQNSEFMIHLPWVMSMGNSEELKETIQMLEDEERKIARLYADITGKNIRTMLNLMREEKFWDATRAQKEGFVDRVIKTNKKKKEESYNMAAIATLPSFSKEMKVAATIRNNQKYNYMDKNEKGLLAQIKALFEAEKKPSVKDLHLSLADGREMEVKTDATEPAAGDEVLIDNKPPEDDTYVTNEGDEIVTEGGKITSVEPYNETQNKAKMNELKDFQAKLSELETNLSEQKEANEQLKNEISEKKEALNTLQTSIAEIKASNQAFQDNVLNVLNELDSSHDAVPAGQPAFNTGSGEGLEQSDVFKAVNAIKSSRNKD